MDHLLRIRKISLFLACLCFFFVTNAEAYSLSGINPSGSPAFLNDVKVFLNPNSGKIKLTGRGDFDYANGSSVLTGHSSRYTMKMDFSYDANTGAVTLKPGGTVSLVGGISSLGIAKNTLLMSAVVTNINILEDSNLWGFNTTNLFCAAALLVPCTADESIYVLLDDAFSGNFNGVFKTTGFAVTTIPVPAAAWLFGSALLLLTSLKKRRSGTRRF
jgi:hypothetical protein